MAGFSQLWFSVPGSKISQPMSLKVGRIILKKMNRLARQLPLFALRASELAFGRSDPQAAPVRPTRRAPTGRREKSSDPQLFETWSRIALQFFPARPDLLQYTVYWTSRPQRRTLASCNFKRRRVCVARELRREDCAEWLEPLLYHEMCHAVLGDSIGRQGDRRAWHGPQFKALERLHPRISDLDRWIRSGGWSHIVRSDRARSAARKRRSN